MDQKISHQATAFVAANLLTTQGAVGVSASLEEKESDQYVSLGDRLRIVRVEEVGS